MAKKLAKDILELISLEYNSNEICELLDIEKQELYEELLDLKNKGLNLRRKYYSNGTMLYKTIDNVREYYDTKKNERTLITDFSEQEINFLVISDLHFGNELERLDLVDKAFDYCAKNGINNILACGDLIDGTCAKKNTDVREQAMYFIKNYPQDNRIQTFAVAGDRDFTALRNQGVDLIELCNNYRHDVVIAGYNNAKLNIKNDKILLFHEIRNGFRQEFDIPLLLQGGKNRFEVYQNNAFVEINIPPLSYVKTDNPGAVELIVRFNGKGYIRNVTALQIDFDKDIVSEETFKMPYHASNEDGVQNEEDYIKKLVK